MTNLNLPIKGLVARKSDYTVRYDADDAAFPYALYRGDTWIGSYAKRKLAIEEMTYRLSLADSIF